ncbi:MAG: TAXI family TRAP transporter solute-binding subunit [Thermodesulfobacteriota bacterium]
MKNERRWTLFGIVYLALMLAALPFITPYAKGAPSSKPDLPARITYASHAVGTSHHGMVTALSKVASERTPIMVLVSPTAGPPAWVPLMSKNGNPELGSAHSMDAWWAYTGKVSPVPVPGQMLGTKPFYQTNSNLRVLMAGPRMATGFLVRADSPIKTARDLVGKRVASGYLAQPSALVSMIADVLNAGITTLDGFIRVEVPGPVPGVKAVQEGRADATNAAVGMGVVAEADASVGVRFLPGFMDPQSIRKAMVGFPGGTYKIWKPGTAGIKVDTPLWTYATYCVTSTHLPDAVAYELLNAWWNHHKETWSLHPVCPGWTSDMFVIKDITVPYHNGAIKFYKEKGVWDAAMDRIQERLLKGEYPFMD